MKKVIAALNLFLRFLRAVIVSGFDTVRVIIAARGPGGRQPAVAFLRVGFAPMSPTGAALLGALVCLTPGTTTINIDMERHELSLHVLDASDPERIVQSIRREFEPSLKTLFGRSPL